MGQELRTGWRRAKRGPAAAARSWYKSIVRWLALVLMLACSDDSERRPATESRPASVEETEAEPETAAPSEVEATDDSNDASETPTSEGCVHVVLDQDPPLRVRSEPNARSEAVGSLANGTPIRVLETQGGWARIQTGWVYRQNIYDTCASPPAVPVLPLGARAFLIVDGWRDASEEPRASLPPVPMEMATMSMGRGELRDVEPIEVTLVTKRGSCVREVRQRTQVIGTCPEYATETDALVVDGCPELLGDDEDRPHLTAPLMVAVFGAHPGSRLEDWPHEKSAPSDAVLAQLPAEPTDVGDWVRFDGGRWSWLYADEEHHLFDRGRLVDTVSLTASEPMRVVRDGRWLVAVGNQGFHGYGFYMFPRAPFARQARELGFVAFTCGPY